MLKAAEDEHAHAEKEREIFAELVRVGAIALHADVDHHVAENGEDERAEQRLGELQFTDALRAGAEGYKPRALLGKRDERCAGEIPQPDDRQRFGVGHIVIEHVADLAGEQMQPARADDEKADREKKRPDDRIFHRQKHRAAKGDDRAGKDRGEKDLFHAETPPDRVIGPILPYGGERCKRFSVER